MRHDSMAGSIMTDRPESYADRLKREGRETAATPDGQRTPADKMVEQMKASMRLKIENGGALLVRTHTSGGRKIKHPASPEAMEKLKGMLSENAETQLDRIEAMLKVLVQKHG
jgi:hypothetical protein